MSNRSSQLPCFLLWGLIFVFTIQLADNRYIPYTPYYPLHPYHEGGAGYAGNGPPPLHGMMPYDHYQPVWTPHGTFFDQRRKVLRVFPGGGVPVIVDYDKRCSDGYIGVKKHPDHAQYYYACKSDCVIFGKCQDYQFFDESKGQCVPYPLPRFEPVCTEPGHFPVYSNCTLYYTCDCDLKSEMFSCPQGTIFSAAQGKCIEGRQCPPTEIAQGSYMPENCEEKYPPCLENGTFRSPTDCSHYYKCTKQPNGVFLQNQFKCPTDTLFDTKQELCLPQQQVACDHVQITHLVYPKSSHKSYQSNYYPYVADSEETSDYTVSQPKQINCSNANKSGEEVLVSESAGPDSSDSDTTTTETTESPTTTTAVDSTVLTTASSTEQPTTTITSTTTSQSDPTTTEESETVSDETTIKGQFPARAFGAADAETSSTTTEVTATTLQSSSSASTTTDESSTTDLGSSSTSISTTERISTTNSISSTDQTGTPTISTTELTSTSDSSSSTSTEDTSTSEETSTTEQTSTTDLVSSTSTQDNSTSEQTSTTDLASSTSTEDISTSEETSTTDLVSSTSTEDKSTSDILSSTTEQISTATTEAPTSGTATSQGTSISTTQTDVTDTESEALTIDSLSAIAPLSTTTTESSLDTQDTLHSSNTNTTTTTTTKIPNSEVLRDSRSIDSITTEQQVANNVSSTVSQKTSEDSESCCSDERMVLDDELMLDQSGSPEEYDSSEENLITSTVSPLSSTTDAIKIGLTKNSTIENIALNTTQLNEISVVQSTTEAINENEPQERSVLSDEIVISTTSSTKVPENRSASTTERTTTNTITSTESDEEYDSQEYEDDTTTNAPLESSTLATITNTIVTNEANTKMSSNSDISNANINEKQVLSDEIVLSSTTPNTPKVNNNTEIPPDQNSSTEEYDSEEYIDEDETTEASQTSENITTESPKSKNNVNGTAPIPIPLHKDENIMIIARTKNEIFKETIEPNTNILEKESKKLSSAGNDIEQERNVLSDEIIINATTVSPSITTEIPQLNIDVTTSASTGKSNSSTDGSFEYESGEVDDEEYEDSSERIVLSDEVIVTTTNSPNTTKIPIISTTSLPADSIPSSAVSIINTTDNINESHTTEEIDSNASSYDYSEELGSEEERESQERRTDNVVVTSTSSSLNTFDEPPTTTIQTQTLNTQNTADDNDSPERSVLSDEIVITTLEPLPQNIAQTTQNETSIPACNTTHACNTTQTQSEHTLAGVNMINLHMRESLNKSNTHLEPVNNTNIIIGGTCVQSPFIPTLNLTIYGDINLHIRFCPRPCNETHEHNYEKKAVVDAVWDSNSSNKTMNLQVVS